MNTQYTRTLILICAAMGLTQGASPQSAEKPGPPLQTQTAAVQADTSLRPVNLKALSKDTSAEEIQRLMHGYTRAIGAPCGYCHEENAETKSTNFASDTNPMKDTARLMIRMTNDINTKYLAQLGDRRYAEPLTCGNCHQGHPSPPAFEPKP